MTFAHTPQAIFALVMSLTSKGEMAVKGIPVCVDQSMTKIPRNPQPPTFRENYASLTRHASPKLDAAGVNKPVSVAFFGGRLDYTRLKPLARLFVNLVFWLTLAIMIRSLSDKRGLAIGIPLFLILGFILFVETAPWTANYMPWSLTNAVGAAQPAMAVSLVLGQRMPTLMPLIGSAVGCIIFTMAAIWRFRKEEFLESQRVQKKTATKGDNA